MLIEQTRREMQRISEVIMEKETRCDAASYSIIRSTYDNR